MKFLILVLAMMTSSAFARQYIQCDAGSFDRAVINLNGDKSTLFLTNGVHYDDELRILKKLHFESNDGVVATYATNEGDSKEIVRIPAKAIGIPGDSIKVTLELRSLDSNYGEEVPMSCFSAIYE